MTRRQPTAVDLDDLLATLTPEMATEFRKSIPPGFADQLDAAQRDSVRLIQIAEQDPAVRYLPTSGVDEWLRLGALDTLIKWVDGTARTCLHMPDPYRPESVWSAAWRPGLIVCTHCLPLLKVSGQADKTCDCCGRITTGPDHGDGITTLTVWIGGLAYQAGACTDCFHDSALEQGETA